ncbi:MAG: S-layer homology domain-containing protein [Acidimicrobiia bacterium]
MIRLDAATTRQADVELGQAGTIVVTVQYATSPNLSFPWSWVIDATDGSVISGNLTGATGTFIVSPGTYFAMGANFLDEREQLWDYFPELYEAAPANRFDLATPISIAPGQTRSVSVTLDPFFPDMFDSVFLSDIFWMQTVGITSGCGEAGYCPDEPVTRGQRAAFLARALQLPSAPGVEFVDVDNSVFERDIERLAGRGITLGCNPPDNDRFCPDQEVTRGQMAAFLVRAMGYANSGVDFEDVGGSVFAEDIRRLATAGVTVGCNPPENDRFCPNEPVSRGQMAAFLHRALGGGVLYPGSAEGLLLRPLPD